MYVIKGVFASFLFFSNTLFWSIPIYAMAIPKFLIPHKGFQQWCSKIMSHLGEGWIAVNNFEIEFFHGTRYNIQGAEGLSKNSSYLVCSNHQSWVDIVALQKTFNYRIPFLRFFLKKELLYVPLLGIAWWALDFPFMKRFSKDYLAKHPEKRGKDLETTRRAMEKFKGTRISIINFLEGTRFRKSKHESQNSPYKYLLNPKTGGLAFVIEAMGEQFESLLDVTIHYPQGAQSLWALLQGKVQEVTIVVEKVQIPQEFFGKKYLEDEQYREKFQAWVRNLWERKDKTLAGIHHG